jgi:hypothetical protein
LGFWGFGDDGEDSFRKRLKEDLERLKQQDNETTIK